MHTQKISTAAALALVLAGCGGGVVVDDTTSTPTTTTSTVVISTSVTTTSASTTTPPLTGGGIDPSLTRDDVDCSPDGVGDDEDVATLVAYYVVEGNLGAVCYGDENQTLVEAWEVLAAIVPGGQLHDLVVFTGYQSLEVGDDVTVAFVTAYDEDGSVFQMSVNLAESEDNPDESRLTMIHEFGHVFTQLVTQIDRDADPESCETYWNGEGCFYDDSIIYLWIAEFWEEYIDDIDPNESPTVEDGEERCSIDPAFLGPYAASNPEEDFAETFSAYVLQVPPDTPEQQEKFDWIDSWPGLAEFRDQAMDAGYGPQTNEFDLCG